MGDGTITADEKAHQVGSEAAKGATGGAGVGGAVGLIAGLGLIAIPGLGPVIAAGWLASTAAGALAGAAVGGAAGGLVGALTRDGVSEDHAHVYSEAVRRGGSLVSARVDDARCADVEATLDSLRAVEPAERGNAYRAEGWSAFDPSAPALTPEQVAVERERFPAHV